MYSGGTIAALLWDVDGTLAETELEGHRRAFNRAFAEEGLPWRWDRHTYQEWLAVSGGRERMRAFLQAQEGSPPAPELLTRLQALKQRHYSELVRSGAVALRPGVVRLIREAAAAGLPQAIVTTSGRAAVAALLEGSGRELQEAFAFWICGEDVARKKPDPEAYRLAIARLGLGAGAALQPADLEAPSPTTAFDRPLESPLPRHLPRGPQRRDGRGDGAHPEATSSQSAPQSAQPAAASTPASGHAYRDSAAGGPLLAGGGPQTGVVVAIEDSLNGLRAAGEAGLACLITLSASSRHEAGPDGHSGFAGALAVLDGLGEAQAPLRVHRGPDCPGGQVTLAWLQTLIQGR